MPSSRPLLQHPSSGTAGTDTTRSDTTALQLSSFTTSSRRQSLSGPPAPPCPPSTPHRNSNQPPFVRSYSSPPVSPNLPITASNTPAPPVKATRFDRSALHNQWTRFKRTTGFGPPDKFTTTGTGTGTGSSSVDDSGMGADEDGRLRQMKGSTGVRWGRAIARTITSDGDGSNPRSKKRRWGGRKQRDDDMEMGHSDLGNDHVVPWTNVRRHTDGDVDATDEPEDEMDDAEVDAVVVDNQFLSLDKSTQRSQSTHPHHHEDTGTPPTGPTGSTSSGVAESRMMVLLRYRIWPVIERFFSLHFHDPVAEAQYRRETFYTGKTLAFWASCFLLLNWILGAALLTKPYTLQDSIFFFGVAPFLTVPLPVFVTFDWPRTHPWIYQMWLGAAVWAWGFYTICFMHLCGKYGAPSHFDCENKDFLVLFYYVTGLPVIAIFAMQQNRTVQTTLVVAFICTAGGFFLPYNRNWIRHILNLIIFHAFILYINWMRETAERRLYVLRDQLKTQYKQTQKAQISERKSSESKRRLTSYIFHEVRVPLNTALLAAQNLAGTGAIQREHEIEFNALEGSLNMMSKVLNDVLDFNRMDSGRFETVSKPFAFHAVIRSMLVPLGLGASAKGLQLIVELDEEIDRQARLAAYRAQAQEMEFGSSQPDRTGLKIREHDARKRNMDYEARQRAEEWIAKRMIEGSDEDGIVMGDEMRLRQIVTNLASNACKFTEAGGNITLRTKLIVPSPEHRTRVSVDHQRGSTDGGSKSEGTTAGDYSTPPLLSRGHSGDSADDSTRMLEHIVVRIEVQDTGVGIGQRDMEEKRLFSAFMQTSSGLRQGGKGTGLGLALVRHIVALSGGRLGVKSKRAVGSTFWIELPLGVGRKAVAGVHATRARDAAVDAINFSGSGAGLNLGTGDSRLEELEPGGPTEPESGNTGVVGLESLPSNHSPGPDMALASSSGDVSSAISSGALLAAAGPGLPLQGGSTLRSIMEHGGVVELVPQLPLLASAEEGPIVATRTLSPDSNRPSTNASPVASRVGAMSDPSASRIVMSDPGPNVMGATAVSRTGTLDRTSPKPSAHRQMPSDSSLAPLKFSETRPGPFPVSGPGNGSPVKGESLAPLKVLVVDDDPLTRRLMTRMLTRLGCTVDNAENGQIALDMLLAPLPTPRSQRTQSSAGFPSIEPGTVSPAMAPSLDFGVECKYDIVFLDNHMPICSGVEVARRLRKLERKDFVVGVTGNALTEDQQEYLQAGANHVLTKPVLEKSLKAMLVLADERRKSPASFP
ncbi:protein-histidine kinase [Ceratobasidium sp. AG-Ba]|nr:protein-histidine kinase [Ceratobasidium sp. AG-Ba]